MPSRLRLLSWNVQRPGRGRLDAVVDAIVAREPDVLTLQEANDALVRRLAERGFAHQVYGRDGTYPTGKRKHVPKHGALIASKTRLEPEIGWTKAACYPGLFARAAVETSLGTIDMLTAHIPNGSANGWRKAQHCQVLGRVLRDAPPATRILTGDFNEPRAFMADGRVVSFAASIDESGRLALDGEVRKGIEDLDGPHTWREWDRAVCDLFRPSFHGLTHVVERAGGSLRPMPVTHETRSAPRFFDHALVSRDLAVVEVTYLHELRTGGVSDHSPLLVELRRRPVADTEAWAS